MARIAQLIAEAAIAFIGIEAGLGLIGDLRHPRFQSGKRGPIAPVQRQFPNRRRIHGRADSRRGCLYFRRRRSYLNRLADLSNLHCEIQRLLRGGGSRKSFLHDFVETSGGDRDLVFSRQQVGRRIKTVAVCRYSPHSASLYVLDGDLSVWDARARWVGAWKTPSARAPAPSSCRTQWATPATWKSSPKWRAAVVCGCLKTAAMRSAPPSTASS